SYFVTEHVAHGYANFDSAKVTTPYLPLEGSRKLSAPGHCFTDDGVALFGFDLLRKDLHPHALKFGVKQHPSLNDCIDILVRKPPSSTKEAKPLYEYFARRLGEINTTAAERIGRSSIVPTARKPSASSKTVFSEERPVVRYITPRDCYLGDGADYGDIFDFVDFGQEANLFLLACGSKREPTKLDVATILVKEPARILLRFQN